jgi:predicted glycosyltransferase
MKILIDIGHPGHVHLFKNFAFELQGKGDIIKFTTRQKEYETELLAAYKFDYVSFGKHFSSLPGKIFGLFKFDLKLLLTALKFRPDVFVSHGSIYAAHVSWLMGKPHLSMEDSGNMEQIKLYRPFTKAILTPEVLPEKLGNKQIRYNGYHEIAYLHPAYFKPDSSVKQWLGLKNDEKFCIIRFVSWKATHDLGHSGFSAEEKMQLILKLSEKFRVFISSEATLPEELKKYQIKLPPHLIHHALAFAEIVISEGATIASEAGVLGTPSIYVNSIERSYNQDQEKYGTVYNFRSGKGVLEKAEQLLSEDKQATRENSRKLIKDKIDVTAFMVWFIKHYPDSFNTMKENPDYQNRFK